MTIKAVFLIVITMALGACQSVAGLEEKEASYFFTYDGVDRDSLVRCATTEYDSKNSGGFQPGVIRWGDPVIVEHWWRLRQMIPMFLVKYYTDKVEINGRYNIWGDYGKDMLPTLETCVSSLTNRES